MQQNRRHFLKGAAVLSGSALLVTSGITMSTSQAAQITNKPNKSVEVFVNQYTVHSYYAREGVDFPQNIDSCFAELKKAGFAGFEATVGQPGELDVYMDASAKQSMQLRSIYSGANLHDEAAGAGEVDRVIKLGEHAKSAGTKFIVVNLHPKSGKSDAELIRQNKHLDTLGAALRELGIRLAMHYHTTELEFAGREFHSFLCDTSPENVALCFDVHWSFRASGNSAVSAYNHAQLYADRVVELHLRQSQDNIWTETFVAKADIDYEKTLAILQQNKAFDAANCHVVLEQAPENGTPKTLTPLEIFKQSIEAVQKMGG